MGHYKSAKKVWWLHDIVDYRYLEDDGFKSVDEIVALSGYSVSSYSDFYGIPSSRFTVIGNDDSIGACVRAFAVIARKVCFRNADRIADDRGDFECLDIHLVDAVFHGEVVDFVFWIG